MRLCSACCRERRPFLREWPRADRHSVRLGGSASRGSTVTSDLTTASPPAVARPRKPADSATRMVGVRRAVAVAVFELSAYAGRSLAGAQPVLTSSQRHGLSEEER